MNRYQSGVMSRKTMENGTNSVSPGIEKDCRPPEKPVTRSKKRGNAFTYDKHAIQATSVRTPRKSKRKVRSSDPGHRQEQAGSLSSTGLTPVILRTSFNESGSGPAPSTPTRSSRGSSRRSVPYLETSSVIDPTSPHRELQFRTMRQIIDQRSQRRIRRMGLSHEINEIEREKRAARRNCDQLKQKDAELARLRQMLEAAKSVDIRSSVNGLVCASEIHPRQGINREETESLYPEQENVVPANCSIGLRSPSRGDEMDFIMTPDCTPDCDTLLVVDSPSFRGNRQTEYTPPPSPSLSKSVTVDVSTQASIPDRVQEAEMCALSLDLESAQREKRELFNEWRTQISSAASSNPHDRSHSPPPDFMRQIVPSWKAALTHASDACVALDTVLKELSGMGFPGRNADEIISEMRHSFRSARLELEHAIPGETTDAALDNGYATLNALVGRVKMLANEIRAEHDRHRGSLGREKALRGQFDACLKRHEAASMKIKQLEETVDSFANDMLHARMRIQQLEKEAKEKDVGIDRLKTALGKYHNEVKDLESVISTMESDISTSQAAYRERMSDLESKNAAGEKARLAAESVAAEHGKHIHELQAIIEQNRIRVCDLTAMVECMEKERRELMATMAQNYSNHKQELGSMNGLVSNLATSLKVAKEEAEKLQRRNSSLEVRLQLEGNATDRMCRRLVEVLDAEYQSVKARRANWKIKSDGRESEVTMPDSEPITPVSVTRFADIRVGRGKSRERLDSGIGIFTEESGDVEAASPVDFASELDLPNLPGSDAPM